MDGKAQFVKMSNSSTLPPQQAQEILIFLTTGGFTIQERKALAFLKCFTGIIGLVASLLLIHIVLRKHRKNRSDTPTFHRFLLGLSTYDVLYDISAAVGVLAVPRSPIAGGYGTIGTRETCTAQGFFFTLSLGSFIYNTGLSIYYILVIRYGTTERKIVKYLEPPIHFLALTIPLGYGIRGLIAEVYNPPVFLPPEIGCSASVFPPMCVLTGPHTCERGHRFSRWITFFYGTEYVCIVVVAVMSAWLYWTVRSQYRSSSRYASQETEQMRQRTRAVACQAFLFSAACFYTAVWGYIVIVGAVFHFPLPLMKFIVFNWVIGSSSQGFFNFMIYTHPRYNRLRQRKTEIGRWGALMEVIFGVSDQNRHQHSSFINKLGSFMRRSSLVQEPPSFPVIIERSRFRRNSLAHNNNNNTNGELERGSWGTLMAVMFGANDEFRVDTLRSSFVVLCRRRPSTTTLSQPQLSEAILAAASPGSTQGQIMIATPTNVENTGIVPHDTEMGECLQDSTNKNAQDGEGELKSAVVVAMTLSSVDCGGRATSTNLNANMSDVDIDCDYHNEADCAAVEIESKE